jgi:hypothetical protein
MKSLQNDSELPREAWFRWTAETAQQQPRLASAIKEFEAVDTPDGERASDWLKYEALSAYPTVVTWVTVVADVVQGFYGLTGTQVRLSQRDRRRLLAPQKALTPDQPASFITHFARHRTAVLPFRSILLHAISTAVRVQALQGNVALVLDPHSEQVAEHLSQRYGFRAARGDTATPVARLWLPLPVAGSTPNSESKPQISPD